MVVPYVEKVQFSVFGAKAVTVNFIMCPEFLTFGLIYLVFAFTTYTLTRKKWYDKLILIMCSIHTYCCIYVYVFSPYYVGFIISISFVIVILYGLFYSVSRYGFSLSSCRTVWRAILTDYQSYQDNFGKPKYTTILLKRITLSCILADKTLSNKQKLKKAWYLFYFTYVLGFIVFLNTYFETRRLIKLILVLLVISKPFIVYLYSLGSIIPVTLWDSVIYKISSYFSLTSLFLALVSQCVLVLLALCFDKEGWVKEFETFYGKRILSAVNFNSPYKSMALKGCGLIVGVKFALGLI